LAFVENGKVLWEATSNTGGAPHFLQLEENETAQQAVDRIHAASPIAFFMNTALPGRIVRYGDEPSPTGSGR
jgi:hypothetical protein